MPALLITVTPNTTVDVTEGVPRVSVDVSYWRVVDGDVNAGTADVGDVVRDTARFSLDSGLRGTFRVADTAPKSRIDLSFLGGDGTTKLAKSVEVGSNESLSVALTKADVATILAEPPLPEASVPPVPRRAYLVPTSNVRVPFEASTLQVAPVTVAAGGWNDLALNKLFLADTPATTSIDWPAAGWAGAGNVSWIPAHLGIDGRFSFAVSRGAGDAWLWWLNGPLPAIGIVLDDLERTRVETVGVPLPPFSGMVPLEEGSNRVPFNVTEPEVVENPGTYSEDPGEFCRPFKNPERVLGERSFFVILRAEQPVISGESSVIIDPIPTLGFAVAADVRSTGIAARAVDTGHVVPGGVIADTPDVTVARHALPTAYVDILRRFNRGRTDVDARNPIQWESDISRYQASTVARGHILEFRMRWRSNGYSLGTVAKTLTLAPRQTRRIQKIEWRRVEAARRRESTGFREQASDSLERERDYDDAVQSHLSEWSKGHSEATMKAGAVGAGFATAGFVIGGGGVASKAVSDATMEGGRSVSASEEQRLRDSIRRYGDSLRQLDSIVVTEVTQEETTTGTTEVVRNQNYAHSLTIIYYQILRHLRIETGISGVRECLFVPFPLRPFTVARALRWRDALRPGLLEARYAPAFDYLKDVQSGFAGSKIPPGRRSDQPVRYLYGSLFVNLAIDRPRDKDDGNFDPATWALVQPFLGAPALAIFARLKAIDEAQRDAIFQRDHAGKIAAGWADTLTLEAGGMPIGATDFTLATQYRFNTAVRIDFTIANPAGQQPVTRELLSTIRIKASRSLPPGSIANLQSISFTYQTDQFERSVTASQGSGDLVDAETGVWKPEGATSGTIPTPWEREDLRAEMIDAVSDLVEHLNRHVVLYHKHILWRLDRDELWMLLDGFYVPGTNGVSIASVVERDPIAIMGNALVFRVSSGAFLGLGNLKTPSDLLNYYVSHDTPSEPILVSLPTDGLYAQAVMDECSALEEHYGNTDWALDDPDPELGDIAAELMTSRRAEPATMQPSPFPQTLINLQNAPEAPAPTGLGAALSAVTNANAFRDLAGLAGTQANAAAAMQAAASLATNFGNQAAALKLADLARNAHETDKADKKLATVERALDKGLVTPEEAQQHTAKILDNLHTTPETSDEARAAAMTQAIETASSDEQPWSVEHTDALGSTKVSSGGGSGILSKTGPTPGISPFPAKFDDPVTVSGFSTSDLEAAFEKAITFVKNKAAYNALPNVDDLPIAIVHMAGTGHSPMHGAHLDQMYYSGSLLKIAAMYAAFQLRHVVNQLGATLDAKKVTEDQFFEAMKKTFDKAIAAATPAAIKSAGTTGNRPPQYRTIFDAKKVSDKWTVQFRQDATQPNKDFAGHLKNMVVDSHNPSAGFCIQQLGFSLIDGLLEKAGLFTPDGDHGRGIWLAGDYLGSLQKINEAISTNSDQLGLGLGDAKEERNLGISGWKAVRIRCENDSKTSKQAATCADLVRFMVLLKDGKLVDATDPADNANTEMLTLLQDAVSGSASSLVGRVAHPDFDITASKIGVGDLNAGPRVFSELLSVKEKGPKKREFVIAWQNVNDATNTDLERIQDIIAKTMAEF